MLVHFNGYTADSPRISYHYKIIRPAYSVREDTQPTLEYLYCLGSTSTEHVESLQGKTTRKAGQALPKLRY